MGCGPRNAVWSGMQPLKKKKKGKKSQQKTRLSFNSDLSTSAAAPGPSPWPRGARQALRGQGWARAGGSGVDGAHGGLARGLLLVPLQKSPPIVPGD